MSAHPDDAGLDTAADRQFVSFELGGERFAVPMRPVQEIIRLPEVARLPLAPAALLGLSNLRGRVLPLVSLRRLVGLPDLPDQDAARALVIHCGQTLGFLVDRVCSVLHVDAQDVQPADAIRSIVRSDCLSGLIRRETPDGRTELLMVLDFERLVREQFAAVQQALEREARNTERFNTARETDAASAEQADLRLVSFTVAAQEYAVPIEAVQEIVQLPDHVTEVPQAPPHVLGVMTLRQRLLPLVDLRSLFGLDGASRPPQPRVVVIARPGSGPVGLVTDTVKEVIGVPRALADPMPEPLTLGHAMSEFDAICRLDEGRRLVSVLAPERLLGEPELIAAAALGRPDGEARPTRDPEDPMPASPSPTSEPTAAQGLADGDDLQLVVFRLGDEEFGVPIMVVQEIVRVPAQLTRVPRTPSFVEGVINLRGAVLPVIDQRGRMGLGSIDRNDRQRIMVLAHGKQRTGFIVDAVAEVLRVPARALAPAPSLDAAQARLIRQVAQLDGQRMVLLVDPQELLGWQAASTGLRDAA